MESIKLKMNAAIVRELPADSFDTEFS